MFFLGKFPTRARVVVRVRVLRPRDLLATVNVAMRTRNGRHLLVAIVLLGAAAASSFSPVWSQSKIDYKVVPMLQPMKEVGPTPHFSCSSPDGMYMSLEDFRGYAVVS